MFIVQTLSVVSIILGVYILSVFIKDNIQDSSKNQLSYHIGCFLNDHNLSHSSLLASKVSQFQQTAFPSSETTLVSLDYFNKRGVQVARNFQNFIDNYLIYKESMRSQVELSKATFKAFQDYTNCSQFLSNQSPLQPSDCAGLWNQYEKCFIQLDQIKGSLRAALEEKNKIQEKISKILSIKTPGKAPSGGKAELLQRQYRKKDRLFEEEQRQLQKKDSLMKQKMTMLLFKYSVFQNDTEHARKAYSQCHDNIEGFKICEQLSQQVRSLGYGSIESLQNKLIKKRQSLVKIQIMLSESSGQEGSLQLQSYYERGLKQYLKIHKLFADMMHKKITYCGCDKEQQKILKQAYLQANEKQKNLKKQISNAEVEGQQIVSKISLIQEKRKKLKIDLETDLKNLNHHKEEQINIKELLNDLEDEDRELEDSIITYEKKFNSLNLKCNQIKDNLSSKLSIIDEVKECMNKKYFYEQMKIKLDRSNKGDAIMDQRSKKKLKQSIIAFTL